MFHYRVKHLEVRQKYSAARRIFNSLLGVLVMKHVVSCLIYYATMPTRGSTRVLNIIKKY